MWSQTSGPHWRDTQSIMLRLLVLKMSHQISKHHTKNHNSWYTAELGSFWIQNVIRMCNSVAKLSYQNICSNACTADVRSFLTYQERALQLYFLLLGKHWCSHTKCASGEMNTQDHKKARREWKSILANTVHTYFIYYIRLLANVIKTSVMVAESI